MIFIIFLISLLLAFSINYYNSIRHSIKPAFYLIPVNSTPLALKGTVYNPYPMSIIGNYVIISPDLWNIKGNSNGYVWMNYSTNVLHVLINFTSLYATNIRYVVVGYPEMIYGYKPWGQYESLTNTFLPLPMNISKLPSFYSILNYSVNATRGKYDYSYDIWITRHFSQNGAYKGDVEIMIWMYWYNLIPAGTYIANVNIPTYINGNFENLSWQVWIGNMGIGNYSWTIVTFRLSKPISFGEVGVNIPLFIKVANDMLMKYDSWSLPLKYYVLNDLEIGLEYAPPYQGSWLYAGYYVYDWYIAFSDT